MQVFIRILVSDTSTLYASYCYFRFIKDIIIIEVSIGKKLTANSQKIVLGKTRFNFFSLDSRDINL